MIVARNYTIKETKSVNFFVFLILVSILSSMGAYYYNNTSLNIVSYASECLLIVYTILFSKWTGYEGRYISVCFCSLILVLNYLLSPNNPIYSDLLKYVGYFCCFHYGFNLAKSYNKLKVSKIILYLLIIVPAFFVAFFDDSVFKDKFFRSSNGFVYLGVSIATLFLLVSERNRRSFVKAIIIAIFYVLICTSLGVLVAALLSIMILNLKRSHLLYVLLGGIILGVIIVFVDLPIFIRIRDVFNVWNYMYENNVGFNNVDIGELNGLDRQGERKDASSSVWRIVHWLNLVKAYVVEIWTIPFGMGAGFSVFTTGYYPHNCYLQILIEYGLIVFVFFLKFVQYVYSHLHKEGMLFYFILTMLLYYLTENLLSNFPPGTLMYFSIGWALGKYGYENKNNIAQVKKSVIRY